MLVLASENLSPQRMDAIMLSRGRVQAVTADGGAIQMTATIIVRSKPSVAMSTPIVDNDFNNDINNDDIKGTR